MDNIHQNLLLYGQLSDLQQQIDEIRLRIGDGSNNANLTPIYDQLAKMQIDIDNIRDVLDQQGSYLDNINDNLDDIKAAIIAARTKLRNSKISLENELDENQIMSGRESLYIGIVMDGLDAFPRNQNGGMTFGSLFPPMVDSLQWAFFSWKFNKNEMFDAHRLPQNYRFEDGYFRFIGSQGVIRHVNGSTVIESKSGTASNGHSLDLSRQLIDEYTSRFTVILSSGPDIPVPQETLVLDLPPDDWVAVLPVFTESDTVTKLSFVFFSYKISDDGNFFYSEQIIESSYQELLLYNEANTPLILYDISSGTYPLFNSIPCGIVNILELDQIPMSLSRIPYLRQVIQYFIYNIYVMETLVNVGDTIQEEIVDIKDQGVMGEIIGKLTSTSAYLTAILYWLYNHTTKYTAEVLDDIYFQGISISPATLSVLLGLNSEGGNNQTFVSWNGGDNDSDSKTLDITAISERKYLINPSDSFTTVSPIVSGLKFTAGFSFTPSNIHLANHTVEGRKGNYDLVQNFPIHCNYFRYDGNGSHYGKHNGSKTTYHPDEFDVSLVVTAVGSTTKFQNQRLDGGTIFFSYTYFNDSGVATEVSREEPLFWRDPTFDTSTNTVLFKAVIPIEHRGYTEFVIEGMQHSTSHNGVSVLPGYRRFTSESRVGGGMTILQYDTDDFDTPHESAGYGNWTYAAVREYGSQLVKVTDNEYLGAIKIYGFSPTVSPNPEDYVYFPLYVIARTPAVKNGMIRFNVDVGTPSYDKPIQRKFSMTFDGFKDTMCYIIGIQLSKLQAPGAPNPTSVINLADIFQTQMMNEMRQKLTDLGLACIDLDVRLNIVEQIAFGSQPTVGGILWSAAMGFTMAGDFLATGAAFAKGFLDKPGMHKSVATSTETKLNKFSLRDRGTQYEPDYPRIDIAGNEVDNLSKISTPDNRTVEELIQDEIRIREEIVNFDKGTSNSEDIISIHGQDTLPSSESTFADSTGSIAVTSIPLETLSKTIGNIGQTAWTALSNKKGLPKVLAKSLQNHNIAPHHTNVHIKQKYGVDDPDDPQKFATVQMEGTVEIGAGIGKSNHNLEVGLLKLNNTSAGPGSYFTFSERIYEDGVAVYKPLRGIDEELHRAACLKGMGYDVNMDMDVSTITTYTLDELHDARRGKYHLERAGNVEKEVFNSLDPSISEIIMDSTVRKEMSAGFNYALTSNNCQTFAYALTDVLSMSKKNSITSQLPGEFVEKVINANDRLGKLTYDDMVTIQNNINQAIMDGTLFNTF